MAIVGESVANGFCADLIYRERVADMNARSSDLQIAVTLALLILSWSCRGEGR